MSLHHYAFYLVIHKNSSGAGDAGMYREQLRFPVGDDGPGIGFVVVSVPGEFLVVEHGTRTAFCHHLKDTAL